MSKDKNMSGNVDFAKSRPSTSYESYYELLNRYYSK